MSNQHGNIVHISHGHIMSCLSGESKISEVDMERLVDLYAHMLDRIKELEGQVLYAQK